ncbi:44439_t:CDS:1, partial [Gigaspora margarita]
YTEPAVVPQPTRTWDVPLRVPMLASIPFTAFQGTQVATMGAPTISPP